MRVKLCFIQIKILRNIDAVSHHKRFRSEEGYHNKKIDGIYSEMDFQALHMKTIGVCFTIRNMRDAHISV